MAQPGGSSPFVAKRMDFTPESDSESCSEPPENITTSNVQSIEEKEVVSESKAKAASPTLPAPVEAKDFFTLHNRQLFERVCSFLQPLTILQLFLVSKTWSKMAKHYLANATSFDFSPFYALLGNFSGKNEALFLQFC